MQTADRQFIVKKICPETVDVCLELIANEFCYKEEDDSDIPGELSCCLYEINYEEMLWDQQQYRNLILKEDLALVAIDPETNDIVGCTTAFAYNSLPEIKECPYES